MQDYSDYTKQRGRKVIGFLIAVLIFWLGSVAGFAAGVNEAEAQDCAPAQRAKAVGKAQVLAAKAEPSLKPQLGAKGFQPEFGQLVEQFANEYQVPGALVWAVMQVESNCEPDKVNGGSYGLMQINKINFAGLKKELGIKNFLEPRDNIRAGVYMLGQLLKKYHSPNLALMAYNLGESGAKSLWRQGVYSTGYSRKVLKIYAALGRAAALLAPAGWAAGIHSSGPGGPR